MAWVTPITDRVAADLVARNAKAFINVADWERIDGNTTEVQTQLSTLLDTTVTLTDLTPPTTATFPSAADINTLIENIDLLRIAAALPVSAGVVALDYDYQPGVAAIAPDYVDVNSWEEDLDLMHTLVPLVEDYVIHCGVAAVGQTRLWQARFRG